MQFELLLIVGSVLDRIDYNIEQANIELQQGHEQLVKVPLQINLGKRKTGRKRFVMGNWNIIVDCVDHDCVALFQTETINGIRSSIFGKEYSNKLCLKTVCSL